METFSKSIFLIPLVLLIVIISFNSQDAHAATFTAVKNGSWHDPQTWGGKAPSQNDDTIIPKGISVFLDTHKTPENRGIIDIAGELTTRGSDAQILFTNYGTIKNTGEFRAEGSFSNYGTIKNTGEFSADKTFSNYGTIENSGEFGVDGQYTNHPEGTINNLGELTIYSRGELTNFGTINNKGIFAVGNFLKNSGIINNSNLLKNHDTIINSKPGFINNLAGAVFENTNNIITNEPEATITNAGTFRTSGNDFSNAGTFSNSGTLVMTGGTLYNSGTITNSGFLGDPTDNNYGINKINNTGSINNDCNGVNTLEILVNPSVDACPKTKDLKNEPTEYKTAYENLQHDLEPKVPLPIKNDLIKTTKPSTIAEPKTITQVFGLQKAKDPEQFAKSVGLDYKNGQTRIVLTVNGTKDMLSSLGKIGKVEVSSSNLVQMTIDVKKINDLYKLPYVKKVLIPSDAIQNGIVSEGVGFTHADKIQKKGIEGKGIKIAILDLGFDVKSSEINKVAESKSFRYDFDNKLVPMNGFGTESIHGTAVAEIISDIAPKSELYLYTFSTEAEFLQAMDHAISKKVNLISMSAGWMNYPTDNTSPMTKKVEDAIKKGIPFVVSSGNYAETHWEGKFVDSDTDGWHDFSANDEGLSFNVSQDRVKSKTPIVAYVMWSGKKSVDLNVVLTDPNGKVVASSSNVQKIKGDEFEYIYYVPQTAVTYNLGITSGSSKPNVILEVFAQNDIMEYSISKGSVSVPTDAKGIISVGAINFANAKLEPFSSQGPTNNNKTSPNVVGPDAVKTQAYGKNPFYGTSAAQPHVAGIIALMLEKDPTLTPAKIVELLQINTDKKILPKGDSKNSFGSGKVTADFVEKISAVKAPKP